MCGTDDAWSTIEEDPHITCPQPDPDLDYILEYCAPEDFGVPNASWDLFRAAYDAAYVETIARYREPNTSGEID